MSEGSASSCAVDVSAILPSRMAKLNLSQSSEQPVPENVRKRAAPLSFPGLLMKRARNMMATPDYNAISVLHVLRPDVNFNFVAEQSPAHKPVFTCKVSINEEIFEAKGSNKKMAKLNAAETALKAIMCESDISIPGTHSSSISTSSLESKDVSPAVVVVGSEPMKKEPEPAGTSPVIILSVLRPGLQYFEIINSEDESLKKSKLYRMGVVVDGERFEGCAVNKRLAKINAAEAGLKKLFDLECAHTSDGTPVFTGDSSCWSRFKKCRHEGQETPVPKVLGLPEGKHPLQVINELYPTVLYTFSENSTLKSSERCSACIKIEDTNFEGKGSSKKIARLNAAIAAITFLNTNGLLQRRLSEKRKHKTVKSSYKKPQRPAFLKSNGKPFKPEKPMEDKLKDAVQKLKDKFARVDYQVVSESTEENGEGEAVMKFVVSATVLDKTFTGCGTSKQQARLDAAESAMRGLGLWTEEDETVKEETKRLEMDTARFARMLYGSNRMKGTGGGSRDWRSQGKSWVSGGILAPNPLILPDSNNSGSGGNFGGNQHGSGHSMGGQQNEFGMGSPNGFNTEPQNQFGMGAGNNYGMGHSNEGGMGYQNNYGFEAPGSFSMGEQSGYGMGEQSGYGMGEQCRYGMGEQSGYGMVNYGGSYNDFGKNQGNFCENPPGFNNNWWGQY